jgi:DNA polymerase
MGIQQWLSRDRVSAVPVTDRTSVESATGPGLPVMQTGDIDVASLDWTALEARVSTCERCDLHATRQRTVFGSGDRSADWMVIGEAPGADEDRQGEPFVGRAGKLLTAMLQAVAYRRDQVYITNILKCRPPGNRDPLPDEVACCRGYLERQIELVNPKLILAVGRIAAHNLLGTDAPIGQLRGSVHRFGKDRIPLVVIYHPAYLLRSPLEKRKAWEDLKLARQVAGGG